MNNLLAITLDLDDTLWPVWPAIVRAESAVHDWLEAYAPATARRFDTVALRELRQEVAAGQPDRAHDLSAMRQDSLRLALRRAGDDPALAEAAFDVFLAARQRVDLYSDAAPALDRLSARYPILALTNGNADLQRIGIAGWFAGSVSAGEFGVGKPDPRIFREACRRLGCATERVLHVGDDWAMDVSAARAAGLAACWVRRGAGSGETAGGGRHGPPHGTAAEAGPGEILIVSDLTALADCLGC